MSDQKIKALAMEMQDILKGKTVDEVGEWRRAVNEGVDAEFFAACAKCLPVARHSGFLSEEEYETLCHWIGFSNPYALARFGAKQSECERLVGVWGKLPLSLRLTIRHVIDGLGKKLLEAKRELEKADKDGRTYLVDEEGKKRDLVT